MKKKMVSRKTIFSRGARTLFMGLLIVAPLLFHGQSIRDGLSRCADWPRYRAIDEFYKMADFRPVWNDIADRKVFMDMLSRSKAFGLYEEDYQYPLMISLRSGVYFSVNADSAMTDIRLTDAALHFFSELKSGNAAPAFGYDGLKYVPDNSDVAFKLKEALETNNLQHLFDELQPASREYRAVLMKLNWFQFVVGEPGFRDVKIQSANVDTANKPLLTRLYQLGLTDSANQKFKTNQLHQAVMKAQQLFDLLSDSKLRSTSLQALNKPLTQRIRELTLAVNYFRWLEGLKRNTDVLLLNIPSATLFVYHNGPLVLDSKVIVGKPSTRTPTLTSVIREVILYPYWNVPFKIATKELLPAIKRNIGFLDAGNYQVLSKDGRILDPHKINWQVLSASNFLYIIRQSTGCDNALGIVKFNFYNPFTVYLHDTPSKGLFSFNKRYFSHGCMRVEKPMELAHLLLGYNSIAIDTLTVKGCLNRQSPIIVSSEKTLPVVVLYSTVWYDRDGVIRFFDDVYGKLD